ncbi:MAG TPA: serine/threonine-protein kinase, partial [Aggregicoccus sp.]|nr:serine/threonine-protein kinase [Aggregicoccus sp.]
MSTPRPLAPPAAGSTQQRAPRTGAAVVETLDWLRTGERAWEPPREFDGYRLVQSLGRGGMGQVFLAHDTVLERPTALKVLDADLPGSTARERFLVEARAIARLQHPNVVAIYRVGEVQGRPYLVSEFVPGRSLDALALPLPAAEVLRIGRGLARGLAAAHRRGVLHRDIKPANAILADTGEVKLLDFGLAKLLGRREPEPGPAAAQQPTFPGQPQMTDPGTLMGTPAYMAPEAWLGEPTSFRSDVYSLGALLYHLSEGRPPHAQEEFAALQDAVLGEEPAPPAGAASEPGLAEVILCCLRKAPGQRYASAEALRDALEALSPEHRLHALPEGNPYRGLHAFEAEHRALFFGRDAEIRGLVERLRTEPFVLVAGTSGVGKSSLCRAGLLPRVRDGVLDEAQGTARAWTVVTLTPGKHPLASLATALAPYLGQDEEQLLPRLREEWGEVARELRRRRRSAGPLLLFMDQLEELVTLSDAAEARVMAEVLESLATPGPGLRLLATCRGDYLARLGSLPGMGEELTRALYLLRPLSREAIREAITGPAHTTRVAFESEALIQALVDSTARAEGALPLLQFALAELWEARDTERRLLTAGALAQLGGVEGALARHADGVLERLLPAQRAAARRALLSLVTLEGTRARRTEAELTGEDVHARSALAALVRGRLLVASEASGGSAFEVAHEALIRSWPTLQRWLEEDAESRVVRERLAQAAAEWERLGRKREALWGARQLQELQPLGDAEELARLPTREQGFIAASHAGLRRRRRLRLWAAGGLALLL